MEPSKNTSSASNNSNASKSNPLENPKSSPPPSSVAEDAKDLASKVAGQAKDVLGDQLEGQQQRSAGEIDKVASALRQTSNDLGDSVAAPYVGRAASLLERISGSVKNATLGDTVRAIEGFARRDPVLFLGGSLVLGIVAARFLKSSARRDDNEPVLLNPGDPDIPTVAGGSASGGAGSVDPAMATPGTRGRDGH